MFEAVSTTEPQKPVPRNRRSNANAPRVLLVTTRNLSTSTGEWRLISNRSSALETEFGISTDIIYLRPDPLSSTVFQDSNWSK